MSFPAPNPPPTADAASAPHSPEPADSGRAGGKTLSLLRWARLFSPAPCRGIRGIRALRRLRTPRRGPGGRGRRRTRSPRTARKSPLTRRECSGGIIPRNFPLRPAYPPEFAEFGRISGRSRPGHFPAGRRRPRRKMLQSAPSIFPNTTHKESNYDKRQQ